MPFGESLPPPYIKLNHDRRTIANMLELPMGIRVTIPGWRLSMPRFLCQGGFKVAARRRIPNFYTIRVCAECRNPRGKPAGDSKSAQSTVPSRLLMLIIFT
jgi:hypothetical protein